MQVHLGDNVVVLIECNHSRLDVPEHLQSHIEIKNDPLSL